MGGVKRIADDLVLRAWNDVERFPRIDDVMAELGYCEKRTFTKKIKRLRESLPEGSVISREAHYQRRGRKIVGEHGYGGAGGRYLVARKPKVERWLLTAAQDETAVDEPFWRNLIAYAEDIGAELLVGGFTYNKSLFEDHASRTGVFAEAVRPHLIHDNRMLGSLLFAAEVNILPTAVRPLSGLENFGRGAWTVFPHAKVQLASVPSRGHAAMVMTTGACTGPNYIRKKAGQKAEFHHVLGAVLVEQDQDGRLFCRQIGAAADGSFQDLDAVVRDGTVTYGNRVEAIVWGDIHREQLDPVVARAAWGFDVEAERVTSADSMVAELRPRHQAFHDLLDFRTRNHHRRGDHVHLLDMHVRGAEHVDEEIALAARFLRATARDDCQSVVVASNHNDALLRWLRETDPRADPVNMETWCELNLEWHRRIRAGGAISGEGAFDLVRWALQRHDSRRLDDVVFVPRGGSYLVCQNHGGIEIGLHGDEGPNGARGSPHNLNRVSVRMVIGHGHSPQILDGVMMVGLCGTLDQGYNNPALSSWSHSQGVIYPNARRTLVTLVDGKWRA